LGASDETAKEVKIFGLSDFISGRFKTLINFMTIANWQYAGQFGNFFLSVLGTWAIMPLTHLSFMKLLQENRL
jgi:ATP-binding cassette subfamily B protein